MNPATRRRRRIVRDRRRYGWDTGTHDNLCECRDCAALYGWIHGPLCRCPDCTGTWTMPAAGYSLYMTWRFLTNPAAATMLQARATTISHLVATARPSTYRPPADTPWEFLANVEITE